MPQGGPLRGPCKTSSTVKRTYASLDDRLMSFWEASLIGETASVRNHLEGLFSASGIGGSLDLQSLPHVQRSVLNWGLGDLVGTPASSIRVDLLAKRLRQCIVDFEPRIAVDGLDVSPTTVAFAGPNELAFLLEGRWLIDRTSRLFRGYALWHADRARATLRWDVGNPDHG